MDKKHTDTLKERERERERGTSESILRQLQVPKSTRVNSKATRAVADTGQVERSE